HHHLSQAGRLKPQRRRPLRLRERSGSAHSTGWGDSLTPARTVLPGSHRVTRPPPPRAIVRDDPTGVQPGVERDGDDRGAAGPAFDAAASPKETHALVHPE